MASEGVYKVSSVTDMITPVDSALVLIDDGGPELCVELPSRGSPTVMVDVLTRAFAAPLAGKEYFFANVIREIDREVRVRAGCWLNLSKGGRNTFLYKVHWLNPAQIDVFVMGQTPQPFFSGLLCHFFDRTRWTSPLPSPWHGKLVKFWYEGGTEVGWRVVKVMKVTQCKDGHIILEGKDLARDEADYRSYRADRIRSGEVFLLN